MEIGKILQKLEPRKKKENERKKKKGEKEKPDRQANIPILEPNKRIRYRHEKCP